MKKNSSPTVINFYGVNAKLEDLAYTAKILSRLLAKVLQSGDRALVISRSEVKLRDLDTMLWTNSSWLPHGLITEEFANEQPILLATELATEVKPLNNASTVFIMGNTNFSLPESITKACVLFNLNDIEELKFFEESWQLFTNERFKTKYFKQDNMGAFSEVSM